MCYNASRNELAASSMTGCKDDQMSGRETGRGGMDLVMSKEPEMPTTCYNSTLCWCSLFSLSKMRHNLI